MVKQTLVLIKPDGVKRGLIGEIIKRFEQRGLKIVGLKMIHVDKDFASKHYTEEIARKHGENIRNYLLDYISSGPIIAIAVEGINAIAHVRKIIGSTYPAEAEIGTIRGDFAHATKDYTNKSTKALSNLIHASENEEEAKKELSLWFSINEKYNYKLSAEEHLY